MSAARRKVMSDSVAIADSLRTLAEQSNAWPFEEARKIVARLKKKPKDEVIFETGYGPAGLPHIDRAPPPLIAFSDDMDGLPKAPDNIPNKDLVAKHLGKPLTRVPDPFE